MAFDQGAVEAGGDGGGGGAFEQLAGGGGVGLAVGGVALQLANPGGQAIGIAVGEPAAAALLLHQLLQVRPAGGDRRDRGAGGEVAVELGGGHQAFGFDAEGHQGEVGTGEGEGQVVEFLVGQEAAVAQAPVVAELAQALVLGAAAHEQELHLGVVAQQQGGGEHGHQVVAAALVAGIEHGEEVVQLVFLHEPVVGLGAGPDLDRVGPAGNHAELGGHLGGAVAHPFGHRLAEHDQLLGVSEHPAVELTPEAHERMAGVEHTELHQHIGVEVVEEHQVGGAGEAMQQPTEQGQVGRLGGVEDQIATARHAQQAQADAQAEEHAVDGAAADTLRPETGGLGAADAAVGLKLNALGLAAAVRVGRHAGENLHLQTSDGQAAGEIVEQLAGGGEIRREELAHHREARVAAAAGAPLPAMAQLAANALQKGGGRWSRRDGGNLSGSHKQSPWPGQEASCCNVR